MKKIFYQSILSNFEYEIPKIKGSRFIGNIFHIQSKHEAENYINDISVKYKDATHNCYAYTYGANINYDLFGNLEITADFSKVNDDGEPSNTAGKPILSQIQGNNLNNVLIIVTRYFGGTLLGVGGLIQAYSECAKQTILHADVQQVELFYTKTISFDYNQASLVMNLLHKYNAKIINESHGDNAQITFNLNKGFLDSFEKEICDLSRGQIK